jgi:isoleucyl-tRNA synthetase
MSKEELQLYFVVSKVTLGDENVGTEYENAYVEVKHHEGHKCERCWNYFDELVEHDGSKVCPRCKKVIA